MTGTVGLAVSERVKCADDSVRTEFAAVEPNDASAVFSRARRS